MWQIIDHIPKGVYLNPVSFNTHVRNPHSYFSGTNLEIVRSWRQSPPVQASEAAKRPCPYFLPWHYVNTGEDIFSEQLDRNLFLDWDTP